MPLISRLAEDCQVAQLEAEMDALKAAHVHMSHVHMHVDVTCAHDQP